MTKIPALIILMVLLGAIVDTSATEPMDRSIRMQLIGANHTAHPLPLLNAPVKSRFLKQDKKMANTPDEELPATAWYKDVYPGIDLVCFANDFNSEYVFLAKTGSDPALITFAFNDISKPMQGHGGEIIIEGYGTELHQSTPIVFAIGTNDTIKTRGTYKINHKNRITLDIDEVYHEMRAKQNDTIFNIVPAGNQPGGPKHDFYISKFETSNEQLLCFLNNAEKEKNAPRGANMFFDETGNVWINSRMSSQQDEMFSIKNSNLEYNRAKPEGERYRHKHPDNTKAPFAEHPATGISWLGALKYCNWLTIEAGRGIAERCYTEGSEVLDWAPSTATNWVQGIFTDAERQLWLSSQGFRLPMVNDQNDTISTNLYNEFYKAAAWNRTTNSLYGFGRDTFEILDANSISNQNFYEHGTMPTGYYNGETFVGNKRTHENDNIYGIYDLSGNVAEFANDFAHNNFTANRIIVGGSLKEPLQPINIATQCTPSSSDSSLGFRVVTTYLPGETLCIHILYSFYSSKQEILAKLPKDIPKHHVPVALSDGEVIPTDNGINIIDPAVITYKETIEADVIPIAPETVPATGSPVAPVIPSIPPIINGPFVLTVQSITPGSGVPITVFPTDLTATNTGNTAVSFSYSDGTIVNVTAPAMMGANTFTRWIRTGYPDNVNTTIAIVMNQNVTITADYNPPPLSISLQFTTSPIWLADPIGTTQLISTPIGGTGVYTTYEYEYVLAHHVTYTNWQPSAFVTQVNDFDWNYSIKYHVRVRDSSFTWSPWSNEASLVVRIPGPDPDPITQFGL